MTKMKTLVKERIPRGDRYSRTTRNLSKAQNIKLEYTRKR